MKIEGGSRGRMDPGGGKVLDREWVQEEDWCTECGSRQRMGLAHNGSRKRVGAGRG